MASKELKLSGEDESAPAGRFIVILANHNPTAPFSAHAVEAATEEEAGTSTGGHFVHVFPDKGEESIVFEDSGVKHPLLVQGRPAREDA